MNAPREPAPYGLALFLALGALAVGAVGPIYDSFMPDVVERHTGNATRTGIVMGIDNALALVLVPWCGALSDRVRGRRRRRVPFVLVGLPVAGAAMALLPVADRVGFVALVALAVVMNVALAAQRAPFAALSADLIPSRHRTMAAAAGQFLMCIGAMSMLAIAQATAVPHAHELPRFAYGISGGLLLALGALYAVRLREPEHRSGPPEASSLGALKSGAREFVRDRAVRGVALAAVLLFVAFQGFSAWFTKHAAERFAIDVADAVPGFIAWAIGSALGAIPAAWLGARVGRQRAFVLGGVLVAALLATADRMPTLRALIPLLALGGAAWSLMNVNVLPMMMELCGDARRGAFAGLLFLFFGIAGWLAPGALGAGFDALGSKRGLFLALAALMAASAVAAARIPRGRVEAT